MSVDVGKKKVARCMLEFRSCIFLLCVLRHVRFRRSQVAQEVRFRDPWRLSGLVGVLGRPEK